MKNTTMLLGTLITIFLFSCVSNKKLTPLEVKMKKQIFSPLNFLPDSSCYFYRISYRNSVPDTSFLSKEKTILFFEDSVFSGGEDKKSISNYYFQHLFAYSLSGLQYSRIYKFHNSSSKKANGIEYKLYIRSDSLDYYFEENKIPKSIRKLDNDLINNVFIFELKDKK
jgi:hypothetical protein